METAKATGAGATERTATGKPHPFKGRKLSLTVREVGPEQWDVIMSVDGSVVWSDGPHGKHTAKGRVEDYCAAFEQFINWHTVPRPEKPRRPAPAEPEIAVEVTP